MRRSHMNMSQSWSSKQVASHGSVDFWTMSRSSLGCYSWSWIDSWGFSQDFEGSCHCSTSIEESEWS